MVSKQNSLSRHIAILRIAFGLMWSIDAIFKWTSSFRDSFMNQVKSAAIGQPGWLHPWFHLWTTFLGYNPHLFATLTAIVESLIALALLFGFARRTAYIGAALFSILIWTTAEGFGGPYTASSTDIGTAIIYAVVFFALYGLDRLSGSAWWALDNYMSKKISWWTNIANP